MKKPQFKAAYSLGMAAVYPADKMDAYIEHLLTRAEVAEEKLAEQKEQKADFHVRQVQTEHGRAWVECGADYERGRHFFTRPAPAINLAELVPDEITAGWPNDPLYVNGFNACRAAILRNIEEANKLLAQKCE